MNELDQKYREVIDFLLRPVTEEEQAEQARQQAEREEKQRRQRAARDEVLRVKRLMARQLVEAGFKTLVVRLHPDKGGTRREHGNP